MFEGSEDTKHVLFLCQKAKEVWEKLGMNEVIKRACAIDRAGETVLEFLLLMPDQDLSILGVRNVHEMIAITAWHLWWDRRKLVHEEKFQDAYHTSMGVRAITANFVKAYSPNATSKRGDGVNLLWILLNSMLMHLLIMTSTGALRELSLEMIKEIS